MLVQSMLEQPDRGAVGVTDGFYVIKGFFNSFLLFWFFFIFMFF